MWASWEGFWSRESYNEEDRCLSAILALIQDIGETEDTLELYHCSIWHRHSTNPCLCAFFPTARRSREGPLFSVYLVRGDWSVKWKVAGRQIVFWESVHSNMTHKLTFLSDINRVTWAVYRDGGSWPSFFWHHRCLPENMTHMFKVRVLIQNQLTLAYLVGLAKVKPNCVYEM